MQYDPLKHHRRSIRLKDYDYRRPGAYYVTAVTRGRLACYGEIVNAEMRLNAAGQMVERFWLELPHKFPTIELDAYVVMPNHFHGIVLITDGDPGQGADDEEGVDDEEGAHIGAKRPQQGESQGENNDDDAAIGPAADVVGADLCVRPSSKADVRPPSKNNVRLSSPDASRLARPSLPTLMQWFKTMTTNAYIRGVKTLGWPPFPAQLWQRDYYERVIRHAAELDAIRQYIANNSAQWALDAENPARPGAEIGLK